MNCPNCSYKLVFLQNRLKYKCSKCSRIFLQKFIENKDFQNWNKFQRKIDLQNFKQKKPKLTPEERKFRTRELNKKWRTKNREKCREYCKRHYEKYKENYKEKNLQYYEQNREKMLAYVKKYNRVVRNKINKIIYKPKNIKKKRLFDKIAKWRQKQKLLLQHILKDERYKPYIKILDDSLSTFGLSEQLNKN